MRRPQNLKQSSSSVASKQVEDFFKVLWPFRKIWTLDEKLKIWQKIRLDIYKYVPYNQKDLGAIKYKYFTYNITAKLLF